MIATIVADRPRITSDKTDQLAASLRCQADLIGKLVEEIEFNDLSSETLKSRLNEIEGNFKQLRKG